VPAWDANPAQTAIQDFAAIATATACSQPGRLPADAAGYLSQK